MLSRADDLFSGLTKTLSHNPNPRGEAIALGKQIYAKCTWLEMFIHSAAEKYTRRGDSAARRQQSRGGRSGDAAMRFQSAWAWGTGKGGSAGATRMAWQEAFPSGW